MRIEMPIQLNTQSLQPRLLCSRQSPTYRIRRHQRRHDETHPPGPAGRSDGAEHQIRYVHRPVRLQPLHFILQY